MSDKSIIINSPLIKSNNNASNKVLVHKEGKHASTKISLIKQFEDSFLAKIDIDTGRTHQIRVHSSNIGYPVCGDTEYGNRKVNEKFRKIGLKSLTNNYQSFSSGNRRNIIQINHQDLLLRK